MILKNNPIMENEFNAQARIAQRRLDDGNGCIDDEAIVYAGDALKGQRVALNWLLRRLVITPDGEVMVVRPDKYPTAKSLDNLYKVSGKSKLCL